MNSVVLNREQIEDLANRIDLCPEVGLDTESYGPPLVKGKMLNVSRSLPAGMSIALPDGSAYYIPVAHYKNNVPVGLLAPLFKALGNCSAVWAHNWKHDITVIRQMGYDLPLGCMKDSMLLCWLLSSPDSVGRYGLKGLAKKYLDVNAPTFEETVGDHKFFGALDPKSKACLEYACHDARNTLALGQLPNQIPDTLSLEMRFMTVLHHIESTGMGIDPVGLENLYIQVAEESDRLTAEWDSIFPGVSMSSSKQLREEVMCAYEPTEYRGVGKARQINNEGTWNVEGLPLTPGGVVSTNRESLDIMRARARDGTLEARTLDLKLAYQDVQKIVSTYTRTLVDQAMQYSDQRLHPSYHQAGTATGRLSCSAPNLQNIPAGGDKGYGKMVKAHFVPRPGYRLVTADYSQIELRVLAHYCGEGKLFDAYSRGSDIHQQTADLVGCTRKQGKTINFASVYGAGPGKLGKLCGVSAQKGKTFLDKYFQAYPEIPELKQRIISDAQSDGGVATILGRFRPIPELDSGAGERWRGERLAFNTPIQGGAADIMKLAMVNIYEGLPSDWYMISQVHDEITLEVPEKCVDEAKHMLQDKMSTAYPLKVPLVTDPSDGGTWAECK